MTTPGDFHTNKPRGSTQQGMGGQRGQESEGLKDSAQRLASDAQEQATSALRSGANRGKERLAESLSSVAEALRVSSSHLRDQNQDVPRQYMDRAARQVEQLSNYVRRSDFEDMAHGVENFARRQPAIFLGGAFLLGFAGARFLRSSRRNQLERGGYQQRGYADRQDATGGYAGTGYAAGGYGAGAYGGAYDDGPYGDSEPGSADRGFGSAAADDVSLRGGSSGSGGAGTRGAGTGETTGGQRGGRGSGSSGRTGESRGQRDR